MEITPQAQLLEEFSHSLEPKSITIRTRAGHFLVIDLPIQKAQSGGIGVTRRCLRRESRIVQRSGQSEKKQDGKKTEVTVVVN